MQYYHACGYNDNVWSSRDWLTSLRAQGAAQAFEDAGVLGGIFSHSLVHEQIPDALRMFENVRKPRALDIRHRTLDQKAMFALADGPAQEVRDAKLRAGADFELFRWLWEYDAFKAGQEAWIEFIAGED